jgi:hypothetical protein
VKLDSTVNPLAESTMPENLNVNQVINSDNMGINEGHSDDEEEDEQLRKQWDEFMKESEEFVESEKAQKDKANALTESDVNQRLVKNKNSFDYFSEAPMEYLHKLVKKGDYKGG